jgi:hypothetical protein
VREAKPRVDYTLVPLPVSCIMNCMGIKVSGDYPPFSHPIVMLEASEAQHKEIERKRIYIGRDGAWII